MNNEIIVNSPYYRINFYAYLLLAIINITLNILLIPQYDILGAAIATFTSFAIFELIKISAVRWKFGFFPYSSKTLIVLVLGVFCYGITLLLPNLGSPYLNILMKGGLITATFPILIFKLKISEDYNHLIINGLKKFAPFLLPYFK